MVYADNAAVSWDIDRLCFVVCSTKKIKLGKELRRSRCVKTTVSSGISTQSDLFSAKNPFEKWPEFIRLCQEQPQQCTWLSSYGQNFLHLMCQYRPTVESIRAFLDLVPHAVREADMNGNLPIHIAMTNGASHSVLYHLIAMYPNSVKLKNKWGYNPFDWILNRCLFELSCPSIPSYSRQEIWRTVEVLIKAMVGEVEAKSQKSILHMAFEIKCPVGLIKAILNDFPHMATIRDGNKRVALGTAVTAPSKLVSIDSIKLLILFHPGMLMERDRDGRNPFHLAIDNNQDWTLLKFMLKHEPECIRSLDGLTGLYPFMLLAGKNHIMLSELNEALCFCTDIFNELTCEYIV